MEFEGFSSIVAFSELMSRVMLFHLFTEQCKANVQEPNEKSEFKLDSTSIPSTHSRRWKDIEGNITVH